MHTGHSVYSTVHADSLMSTVQRLTNPPIEVPANLLSAVNLNIVMFRNRRENIRRVYQIGEFLPVEESGNVTIKPNLIYRWNPSTDDVIPHQKPIRFYEELSRHTTLNMREIQQDMEEKKAILSWMLKHSVRDITAVGNIFNKYYLDAEQLSKLIKTNTDPKKVVAE